MVDSNTLALLHFDSNLTDVVGNIWVSSGTVNYISGKFDNSVDATTSDTYLRLISGALSSWINSDFTIDWQWKLPTSNIYRSSGEIYIITGGGSSFTFWVYQDKLWLSILGVRSLFNIPISFSGLQDGNYHHFAIVRNNNMYSLYIDGLSVGSATDSTVFTNLVDLYILGGPNVSNLTGEVDELRISNVARWTSDFTPPTQPYGSKYAYLSNNNLYTSTSLTNLTNNWSGLTNAEKEALVSSFSSNIPSIQDLISISPFRVLTDDTYLSNVKVTGQPKPQTIEPTSLINTGAVTTVQSINITNIITDTTVKFAITTDLTTYKVYDATTSSWVASINIEEDGMSIAQINALTPQILALLDVSNGIAFKQCFIATSENASAELSEISAVVDIDGSWTQSVHGTDYNVAYPNKTTMSVRLLTNGDYIINYPISSNS